MAIRRIFATVDGSEPARRAAERAVSLTGPFEARLTLAHVHAQGAAEAAVALVGAGMIAETRQEGEKIMATILEDLGDIQADRVVLLGSDVVGLLCEAALDGGADLLVAGTVGRTGISRFFLGSVAEGVVRRAHCPVWVERSSEPAVRDVERIVVCTDLSPLSEAGVALAAEFGATLGSAVEIVYALETSYRGLTIEARRELTANLRAGLERIATAHFGDAPPRTSIVEGANVVEAITAHADRTSADLLVLASHGRTGVSRVLLGSVAERVTRFAPCSVLVARSPVSS